MNLLSFNICFMFQCWQNIWNTKKWQKQSTKTLQNLAGKRQQNMEARVIPAEAHCGSEGFPPWSSTELLNTETMALNFDGKILLNKVVPYLITSVGHGDDPGFLAVSPQVTLVINLVVGCCYFPPGSWLLSQPNRSPPWLVPNYAA